MFKLGLSKKSRGCHSNILFCTSIFVLGQDEIQGTITEIAGGQKLNCLLPGQEPVNLAFYVEFGYRHVATALYNRIIISVLYITMYTGMDGWWKGLLLHSTALFRQQ